MDVLELMRTAGSHISLSPPQAFDFDDGIICSKSWYLFFTELNIYTLSSRNWMCYRYRRSPC